MGRFGKFEQIVRGMNYVSMLIKYMHTKTAWQRSKMFFRNGVVLGEEWNFDLLSTLYTVYVIVF